MVGIGREARNETEVVGLLDLDPIEILTWFPTDSHPCIDRLPVYRADSECSTLRIASRVVLM